MCHLGSAALDLFRCSHVCAAGLRDCSIRMNPDPAASRAPKLQKFPIAINPMVFDLARQVMCQSIISSSLYKLRGLVHPQHLRLPDYHRKPRNCFSAFASPKLSQLAIVRPQHYQQTSRRFIVQNLSLETYMLLRYT